MRSHGDQKAVKQDGPEFVDMATRPAQPAGGHLSDDEIVCYVMGLLSGEDQRAIDVHLHACPTRCRLALEHLIAVSQAWVGPEGTRRLDTLRVRTQSHLAAVYTAHRSGRGRRLDR